MPLPRALFLYGLLLGTGLTTYVPATAAWALPALSLALGDVTASLAIAVGFAAGRALPVSAAARRDAIAERPRGLRLVRVLAAASLLAALVAGQVQAAGTVASPGGDPSVEGARGRLAAARRGRLPAHATARRPSSPATTPRSARPSSPGTWARR